MRGPALAMTWLVVASVLVGCGEDTRTSTTTATAPVSPRTIATSPESTPTTIATSPESPPTTITTTTPSAPSPAAASALVTRFYSDYAKTYGGSLTSRGDGTSPPNSTALRARTVRAYGTDRLVGDVRAAKDFDAVLCAQNTPASIKIEPGVARGDTVRVVTLHDFGSPLRVTAVVVATAAGPKIDRIVCP